jgi:hypothetical protein
MFHFGPASDGHEYWDIYLNMARLFQIRSECRGHFATTGRRSKGKQSTKVSNAEMKWVNDTQLVGVRGGGRKWNESRPLFLNGKDLQLGSYL